MIVSSLHSSFLNCIAYCIECVRKKWTNENSKILPLEQWIPWKTNRFRVFTRSLVTFSHTYNELCFLISLPTTANRNSVYILIIGLETILHFTQENLDFNWMSWPQEIRLESNRRKHLHINQIDKLIHWALAFRKLSTKDIKCSFIHLHNDRSG